MTAQSDFDANPEVADLQADEKVHYPKSLVRQAGPKLTHFPSNTPILGLRVLLQLTLLSRSYSCANKMLV